MHAYLDFVRIIAVQNLRCFGILCNAIAVVPASGHVPRKLHRFTHSQCAGMELFLVRVAGDFAHEVLATIHGVTIVENFSFEMRGILGKLAGEGFEQSGLACCKMWQ